MHSGPHELFGISHTYCLLNQRPFSKIRKHPLYFTSSLTCNYYTVSETQGTFLCTDIEITISLRNSFLFQTHAKGHLNSSAEIATSYRHWCEINSYSPHYFCVLFSVISFFNFSIRPNFVANFFRLTIDHFAISLLYMREWISICTNRFISCDYQC